MKYLKCLILNPATKSLKVAEIPQTLQNWYAVIGTNNVQMFHLKGCSCIYADDYNVHSHPLLYGTTFPDWTHPVTGVLIFVGPADEEGEVTELSEAATARIKEEFKQAEIKIYQPRH